MTFLFQLVGWGHAALLSKYHSGTDHTTVTTLDHIHAVFALLPWIQVDAHLHMLALISLCRLRSICEAMACGEGYCEWVAALRPCILGAQ